MFTGIIEEIGTVRATRQTELTVAASKVLEGVQLGDSIAVNGACLTVTAKDGRSFTVGITPETLRRSNLGFLRPGDPVDLERALPVGGRIGGHYVQGHVDGVGWLDSIVPEGESLIYKFSAPPEILRYVVEKGFIALDGISLTVIACDDSTFSISMIPFTQRTVILGQKKPGYVVNIEVDIIGKYVEKLFGRPAAHQTPTGGLTAEKLAKFGFM
jgi:riboflavin synthase